MTIFRAFLHVLNKLKISVVIYTVILVVFSVFSLQSSNPTGDFTATLPDIVIVNDDDSKLANNLVSYLDGKCNVHSDLDGSLLDDALFNRVVSYIIYIPSNYGLLLLNGDDVSVDVKKTGDYESSYTDMILDNYFSIAGVYASMYDDEDKVIDSINSVLSHDTDVVVTSKVDSSSVNNASYYFSFASYSLIACIIYIVGLVMSIFKDEMINKRMMVSSTSYKKVNRILLLSNLLFSLVLWLFYVLISFVLLHNIMFTKMGLIYIFNSLIFTLSVTSLAFFITSLVHKKEAMSGLVNIVSLGSAFTCGAFVPVSFLPSGVLKFAHILPAYYYINSNELVKTMQVVDFESLRPIINNSVILLGFTVLFLILTNVVTRFKNN